MLLSAKRFSVMVVESASLLKLYQKEEMMLVKGLFFMI